MTGAEFEQLWQDTRDALQAASRVGDRERILELVDAWIARWRDIEPLPDAAPIVALATCGPRWAHPPARALAYAHEIAALAERAEDRDRTPAVGWAVDAYAHVTEVTLQVEETREAVEAARRLARSVRPRHRKINAQLARALRNLAADEVTLDARLEIVQELRFLSRRHRRRVKSIDEQLSAALVFLCRSVGRGTVEHVDLVNELGDLLTRWPASVGIAGRYAGELWNAYAHDGLEAEAKDLLAKLESIRDALPGPHVNLEDALAYFRAEITGARRDG